MANKQRIVPHLWFDREAVEAGKFYTAIFSGFAGSGNGSRVLETSVLHNTPSGSVDIVAIELHGQRIMMISAGPLFKFTPAVSFTVACDSIHEIDRLWRDLSSGGQVLMPLDRYPFSERFGWTNDRYGLSWQLRFVGDRVIRQKITPSLLFVGKHAGRAEEAIRFYASVFPDSGIGEILRHEEGNAPEKAGTVKHAVFTLAGQEFTATDSAHDHRFNFNEAVSFMVYCDSQKEIDAYWGKLSASPADEQCGWLKDKFGVSWQIVPTRMDAMMKDADEAKRARVTEAFLRMKKFDLEVLEKAYQG